MGRGIEEALACCLDRIDKGESAEDVLRVHPELRAELEPLANMAAELRSLPRVHAPERLRGYGRPAFRPHPARQGLFGRIFGGPLSLPSLGWGTALSRVAAAFAVTFLLTGGTLVASAGSLPDEPLYAVKLAIEEAQLSLASNPADRAELKARQAEKRLEEVEEAARRGNSQAIEKGLALYQEKTAGTEEKEPTADQVARSEEQVLRLTDVRDKLDDRNNANSNAVAALDRIIQAREKGVSPGSLNKEEKPAKSEDKADKADKQDSSGQAAPGGQDPADKPKDNPSAAAPGQQDKPRENQGNADQEPKGQGTPPVDPGNSSRENRGATVTDGAADPEATPATGHPGQDKDKKKDNPSTR